MNEIKRKETKTILDGIQSQIRSFDSKASMLIAIVSISFSLIMQLFYDKEMINFNNTINGIYTILLLALFISILTSIGLFVSIIFPRKKSKKYNKIYANYYMDMNNKKNEEIKEAIDKYIM